MLIPAIVKQNLAQINLPAPGSHKGQNGKLMIIGGSKLFHAASKWSLDVASKFVDMVFYASVPSNNQLILEAKKNFWNGMVVSRTKLAAYLIEADCILIGPGMERNQETAVLVNRLLNQYPAKKWVIDAGALQMIDVRLLSTNYIITPHHQELIRIMAIDCSPEQISNKQNHQSQTNNVKHIISQQKIQTWLRNHHQPILLLKGPVDQIFAHQKIIEIAGGNAGMTKGGTGDVLAGLVAALHCQNNALVSTVVASFVNKKAGEALYHQVGPFFNASDLVDKIPTILWELLKVG